MKGRLPCAAATAGVVALATAVLAGGHRSGPCAEPPSVLRITSEDEPGEPLIVRGHVFQSDGKTPAAGVILYLYQTDATGTYHPDERADTPRLRAFLRTAADGSYELRTIRPAPYPGETIAAHVHTQLWGDGVPPQYGPELLFDDDPLVTAAERQRSAALGRFAYVRRVETAAGVSSVTLDIRLSSEGSRFESVTDHGLRACAP